ncbi:MAG TPA: thiamine pyrophosphate-dependent enzyme [Steroidobacteraceae bacterium]|jgi:acetolactate synthase-1/2/3 large subunit
MRKSVSAAQAIVESLIEHGVDVIFGIPGVHTYKLFDALYERRREIRFIGTRHEQGAAYMAYGYAKSTGKVGAYTCVPGPGVLNTTAALCTAYAANASVLCLTSEIPASDIGRGFGILHELPDQLATLRSLTKWSERIDHPTQVPQIIAEAFRQMASGRPGPVAVECPWDTLSVTALTDMSVPAGVLHPPQADPVAVESAVELIRNSRRPMIMVGSGAADAASEVAQLAELIQAPVTAHRSGRGIVADDAPYGLGLAAAYKAWLDTDLLIAIGTRMELQYQRWRKFPANLKVVRIDIDPRELLRRPCDVGLVTDAKLGVRALIAALTGAEFHRLSRAAEFTSLKSQARAEYESVQPQVAYLDVIREALPRDGFFVEEICQVGFTARYALPVYAPRTYVSCGYQDNLGFGFMTALGVKVANPSKVVISVSGDGGFMFGVQELATAVQNGIKVISIVFNNRSFGNVRRDQKMVFDGRFIGESLLNPDFVQLATSFGAKAYRALNPAELKSSLTSALNESCPVLIEVPSEPGSEASPWPFLHPWSAGR